MSIYIYIYIDTYIHTKVRTAIENLRLRRMPAGLGGAGPDAAEPAGAGQRKDPDAEANH